MQFNPKDIYSLLPEGTYGATISKIEETLTKTTQKPMLVIHYTVYSSNGEEYSLKDYIVLEKSFLWKLKKMCEATNDVKVFDAGDTDKIAAALTGRNVRLELDVKKQEGFDDQNRIRKVLSSALSGSTQTAQPNVASISADDIPF